MKTEELIAMLASGVTPVDTDAPRKRFQTALAWGGLGAVVVMLLGYGVRPDLAEAEALPMFWVKLAFPLAIAIPAVLLTLRLSRPGMRMGKTWLSCAFNFVLYPRRYCWACCGPSKAQHPFARHWRVPVRAWLRQLRAPWFMRCTARRCKHLSWPSGTR